MGWDKFKAKFIFNFIAVIYYALDGLVKVFFREGADLVSKNIDLTGKRVLDIGSGTGAWSYLMLERGAAEVVGVDFAKAMVFVARKKYGKRIHFEFGDAENLHNFADESFDIVTSSYVLHGMDAKARERVLFEMQRIAKEAIVVHDYGPQKAHWIMVFLEILEGSDYFYFYKNFTKEFKKKFNQGMELQISTSNSLYLAKVNI